MILKDITVTEIAHKAGVSRTWVSLVIHNRKSSKRVRQVIADALGVQYEKLWRKKQSLNGSSSSNREISNVG